MAAEFNRQYKTPHASLIAALTSFLIAASAFIRAYTSDQGSKASQHALKTSQTFIQSSTSLSVDVEERIRQIIREELKRRDERDEEWRREMKADMREVRAYILSGGRK